MFSPNHDDFVSVFRQLQPNTNILQYLQKAGFFLLVFFTLSCDKGLEPPGITSVSGTVHFIGSPKDSVKIFAVVLIQLPPPFTAATLVSGLNTTVLPFILSNISFADTNYTIFVKPDSTYHYLGVAQYYGSNVMTDWRVVAFLHDDRDSAVSLTFKSGEQRTGIDITVRFDSLPRQPFIK
jgi:hypothetical protein